MNIKKVCNFRSVFFLFILGLFCVFVSYKMQISLWFCFAFAIPITFLIYILCQKRYYLFTIYLLFLVFVTTFSFVSIKNYKDSTFNTTDNINIVGKVKSVNFYDEYTVYLVLTDCQVATEDETKKLDSNISVAIFNELNNDINLYDKITFVANRLSGIDLIEDGKIKSFYLNYNIKYKVNLAYDNIVNLGNDANNIEKFREYNRQLLISKFGDKMGNLAYTSLYGDKNYTEKEIINEFKYSGVAHIFSVSGLHITLVAFLINFILKKLKLGKKVSFFVTAFFLLIYCALCSFNSPVVRASIMSLVLMLAGLIKQRYDSLNAISLAGCILLFFNPLSTFDAGFQLSFFAVFGILMFSNLFAKIKIKNKILSNIFSSLLISFCAQLGILPILINTFGYISTYSLLGNLIIVPLFSIFFTILFVVNIFVLLLPFLSFLYYIPKAILYCVVFLNHYIAILPYSLIYCQEVPFILMSIYYLNMYFISKYVVVATKLKCIISLVLVSFVASMYVLKIELSKNKNNTFTIASQINFNGSIMQTRYGDYILINPNLNFAKDISKYYSQKGINKIDAIILLDDFSVSYNKLSYLEPFNPVYILASNNSLVSVLASKNIPFYSLYDKSALNYGDFMKCISYFYNDILFALLFVTDSISICFFQGDIDKGSDFENYLKSTIIFPIDYAHILNVTNDDIEQSFWQQLLPTCKQILLPPLNDYSIIF